MNRSVVSTLSNETHEALTTRFGHVATRQFRTATDAYEALNLQVEPDDLKTTAQRHATAKTVLLHLALLHKLLGLDTLLAASATGRNTLDIDGYRAMVADLDAAGLDEERQGG
ncbi:MAG: hypothetical protein ACK4Z4_03675 [Ferrovibrio sp.]